jgi:hypothetical protein
MFAHLPTWLRCGWSCRKCWMRVCGWVGQGCTCGMPLFAAADQVLGSPCLLYVAVPRHQSYAEPFPSRLQSFPHTHSSAGIVSVAVVLKHAAIFPQHEQEVGQLAREMGFQQVQHSPLHAVCCCLPWCTGRSGKMRAFCMQSWL